MGRALLAAARRRARGHPTVRSGGVRRPSRGSARCSCWPGCPSCCCPPGPAGTCCSGRPARSSARSARARSRSPTSGGLTLRRPVVDVPVGDRPGHRPPAAAAPGSRRLAEAFDVPAYRRGVLTVGPARVRRTDPLGLYARTTAWTTAGRAPGPASDGGAGGRSRSGSTQDLDGAPSDQVSMSDLAFHALREYVRGDDLRHVHWRSSARAGRAARPAVPRLPAQPGARAPRRRRGGVPRRGRLRAGGLPRRVRHGAADPGRLRREPGVRRAPGRSAGRSTTCSTPPAGSPRATTGDLLGAARGGDRRSSPVPAWCWW